MGIIKNPRAARFKTSGIKFRFRFLMGYTWQKCGTKHLERFHFPPIPTIKPLIIVAIKRLNIARRTWFVALREPICRFAELFDRWVSPFEYAIVK